MPFLKIYNTSAVDPVSYTLWQTGISSYISRGSIYQSSPALFDISSMLANTYRIQIVVNSEWYHISYNGQYVSTTDNDFTPLYYDGTNNVEIQITDIGGNWPNTRSNYFSFTTTPPAPVYTYDLTQLSLATGTHSITAKAKKTGYIDSDASNAVSYTVYPKIDPPVRNEVTTSGPGTYVGMKSSFIDEAEEYEYFIDGVSVGKASLSFLVGAMPVGLGGTGSSCTIYGKINSDTVSTTDYTWKVDSNGVWTSQYSINEQIPNVTKVALMSSIAQGNPMAVSLIGGGNIMQSTTPVVVRIYGDGILGLVYHFTG